MIIRKAEEEDAARALGLYEHLIEAMKDSPYRPTWTRGLYPCRADVDRAIGDRTLWLAEEDAPGEGGARGERPVLGAVVRTHTQGDGYEKVSWKAAASATAETSTSGIRPRELHPSVCMNTIF